MNAPRLVHLALAAALLVILVWIVDPQEVGDVLAGLQPGYVLAAIALNLPVLGMFALRSWLVLRRLGYRLDARLLVPAAILGNVAGSLTPASVGDLLRAAMLRSHGAVATTDALALIVYERGLSLYLMALATGVVASWLALPLSGAIAVAATTLMLLALPLIGAGLLRALPTPAGTHVVARLLRRLHEVTSRLEWLLGSPRLLAYCSGLTILTFAVTAVQFWLLARGVGEPIGVDEAWLVLGVSQLAGIVSLLPLGIGAADSVAAALLRRFGMTIEQGAAVAVLSRATITLPLGIVAVLSYLYLVRRATRLDQPTPGSTTGGA